MDFYPCKELFYEFWEMCGFFCYLQQGWDQHVEMSLEQCISASENLRTLVNLVKVVAVYSKSRDTQPQLAILSLHCMLLFQGAPRKYLEVERTPLKQILTFSVATRMYAIWYLNVFFFFFKLN